MSQMESNEMENGLKKMMDGLNDLIGGLDGMVENAKKSMTEKEAQEFASKMKESGLSETMTSAQSSINELKTVFKP